MEFGNLTGKHRVLQDGDGYWLYGLCCDDNKLYCVEWRVEDGVYAHWLALYSINEAVYGSTTPFMLLSRVKISSATMDCCPRADRTHRVYVPRCEAGVLIFRSEGGRLLPARDPLTCVQDARNVAVYTADRLYVCDWASKSVCLVNVATDTEI